MTDLALPSVRSPGALRQLAIYLTRDKLALCAAVFLFVLIVCVQVFAIAALLNCRHQIGNCHLLQRAQVLKARGLQGEPFDGGIAVICRRLAGARFTPEFFSLQTRLAVEGK